MKAPSKEILDYLKTQRVAVLTLEMPDGSPHAATVHFSHHEDPLVFIFETNRDSRKCKALFEREKTRASLVLGFEEGSDSKTLQLDGEARVIQDSETALKESYLQKFPEKKEKMMDPNKIFFLFSPNWWRFTSWSATWGNTIVLSE